MAKIREFDLDAWVKASTEASGVPEKLQDPDVIHDVVTLLASATPARRSESSTARGRSTSFGQTRDRASA